MLHKYKLTDQYYMILESLGVLEEIQLNISNAAPINGDLYNGTFSVNGIEYIYGAEKIDSPHDVEGHHLVGKIFNIGFIQSGDDIGKIKSYLDKNGSNNLIKIYSTIYKVIINLINHDHPDYLILSTFDKSGYWEVYNKLVKTNPLPGYSRKSVIHFMMEEEPCTGVILKKNKI